jgi:FkbM family methyltransferase
LNSVIEYAGRQVTFCDCEEEDCIQGYLLQGHWYELPVLEYIRKLGIGGNYVDAGAYVGTFSVFASLFCPTNTVYAFEPQADIYRKLLANIGINDIENCEAHNVALSDHCGRGKMNEAGATNRGGSVLGQGTAIEVATIDSLELPDVRLMKVDVENSELAVLQGAVKTLASVEHLLIETWPKETCGCYGVPFNGDKIAELLHGLGFLHQIDFGGDTHYWAKGLA